MRALGVESTTEAGAKIALSGIDDIAAFVGAFEILINSDEGVRRTGSTRRKDRFTNDAAYRNSAFRTVHEALFALSNRFDHVWIEGETNYGVRVAHNSHAGGVSLARSVGPEYLLVGQPR